MKIRRLTVLLAILLATAGHAAAGDGDSDRRKYDSFFLEAIVQREKGNSDAAFDLLRHCISIRPDAPEAYFYLAQYYLALKDKDKSLACFEKAAALDPGNSIFLETLAQSYVSNAQTDKAIGVFERLTMADRSRDDVLGMLVQLYQEKGDYDSAIRTLDRLEELEGKNERLSYAKSEMFTRQGNKKAAVAEMRKLADQYPNDLNYRGLYGDVLLMNGQETEALGIYREILREEPDNSKVQMSMRAYYKQKADTLRADSMTMALLLGKGVEQGAKVFMLRQEIAESENSGGDSTRILRYFDRMMEQPQPDADIAILYATYMGLKKMPQDSIAGILRKVLRIAPDNAAARLQLVAYAWQKNDLDCVIGLCKAARQYNPDEMAFYYYQGMAYFRKEDNDSALSAFQNGISVIGAQSDPDIVSDFYAVMGDLLYMKGRESEAYAAYDSCLQWKDDNIGCLNNYAYYLSEKGKDLDKAEQMSYRTVKAEPKNPTYLDTYAWILFMRKRYAEARIYIDQALQNDTDSSAVIAEHAGDIHAVNGDVEKALELWRQAAVKAPERQILIRKIKLKKYIKE